eukprot:TRINITY_DN412_c0_g4_i1.p2 TRINITY_DN412_c0_g4~~TRINITY_DN412_c0_g4_i1.p2  ORF type:complete len:300 (-),score=9.66 TRINITY_DN412_c0_g4_i1:24-923(-)
MSHKRTKLDHSTLFLSSLPLELHRLIFTFIDLFDLYSFSRVSRRCHCLIFSARLDETWLDCTKESSLSLSFLRDWHFLQKLELVNSMRPLPIMNIVAALTGLRTLSFNTGYRGEIYSTPKRTNFPGHINYLSWDLMYHLYSLTNLESICVKCRPGYQLEFVGPGEQKFPERFSNLKSLTLENFHGHVLCMRITMFASLTKLTLVDCWLNQWNELGRQTCLTELKINGGNFTLQHITSLKRLTNLKQLCLTRIQRTKKDPPESIALVTHLNHLNELVKDMGEKFDRKRKKMTFLSKLTFL